MGYPHYYFLPAKFTARLAWAIHDRGSKLDEHFKQRKQELEDRFLKKGLLEPHIYARELNDAKMNHLADWSTVHTKVLFEIAEAERIDLIASDESDLKAFKKHRLNRKFDKLKEEFQKHLDELGHDAAQCENEMSRFERKRNKLIQEKAVRETEIAVSELTAKQEESKAGIQYPTILIEADPIRNHCRRQVIGEGGRGGRGWMSRVVVIVVVGGTLPFGSRVNKKDTLMRRSVLVSALVLVGLWVLGFGLGVAEGEEPAAELLWPTGAPGAPGAVGDEGADKPTVTFFLPAKEKANGAAVVIFPGGGYGGLATDHEGHQIGRWLTDRGIAGFMVKYRHAPKYKHPSPLQDAKRGMRLVRSRAAALGVDPNRIGAMGFSAGGHLVSTLGTHFDAGDSGAADPVERVSCRPDFLILCYPVISLIEPCTHKGSRRNLLGASPDAKLVRSLSNETQVTEQTPPTFLFHTTTDQAVPPENSVLFYTALRKAGVPAEMHIFEKGRHGVGLGGKDPALSRWPTLLEGWLRTRGMLE